MTHFQNLEPETLRSRFGAVVPDAFLDRYVSTLFDDASLIYGAFPDACLRGMAELRPLGENHPRIAEAAFTVEAPWQDQGIGDALLSRIIAGARNRGIREVHMICLATNQRMRHLASKHSADLKLMTGEVAAKLTPHWPTPLSVAQEIAGEYHAFARAVFCWPD
ncbi:MAG: GNAT family N-acetyltransferase [Ruegeria sp.]